MSSQDNLAQGKYTEKTIEMAKKYDDFVIGFIGMKKLVEDNKYSDVVLTPEQIKGVDFKEEKIDLIDLPNFDKIRIYPQNKVK